MSYANHSPSAGGPKASTHLKWWMIRRQGMSSSSIGRSNTEIRTLYSARDWQAPSEPVAGRPVLEVCRCAGEHGPTKAKHRGQ